MKMLLAVPVAALGLVAAWSADFWGVFSLPVPAAVHGGVTSVLPNVNAYRYLNGQKNGSGTCWRRAQSSPSQFRFDPDGMSTFESAVVADTNRPYRVRFAIVNPGTAHCDTTSQGRAGAVQHLGNFRGTCTPQHGGAGHWSIQDTLLADSTKKRLVSQYARADTSRIEHSLHYTGGVPYCP